jgi:signal transduction histidine kinase
MMSERSGKETMHERIEILRALAAHREIVHENEKYELARVLHDELGSALTALAMRLAIIARQADNEPKMAEQWEKADALLASVTQTTRQIQNNLRPGALETLGIQIAISEHVQEFAKKSGIVCKLVMAEEEPYIDRGRAIALFRMLQEALTNVVAHARALHVEVAMYFDNQKITLVVKDDGVGFDVENSGFRHTYGLRNLQERAQFLAGNVQIVSKTGCGTTIEIVVPNVPLVVNNELNKGVLPQVVQAKMK